jgi:hypothetical protein
VRGVDAGRGPGEPGRVARSRTAAEEAPLEHEAARGGANVGDIALDERVGVEQQQVRRRRRDHLHWRWRLRLRRHGHRLAHHRLNSLREGERASAAPSTAKLNCRRRRRRRSRGGLSRLGAGAGSGRGALEGCYTPSPFLFIIRALSFLCTQLLLCAYARGQEITPLYHFTLHTTMIWLCEFL